MKWKGFAEAWRDWKVEIWEDESLGTFSESCLAMLDEISSLSRVSWRIGSGGASKP